MFIMITEMNKSKNLTKDISCKCKCRFDWKKRNIDQLWNDNKCWYECKKLHVREKDYIWNPSICGCKSGKYLASIMDGSAITCDEVIDSCQEETKTVSTNSNEKKAICKVQSFYVLLVFLLITIVLLIFVSIYCYLIMYRAKQKYLFPFHDTNSKLRKVLH